MTRRDGSRVAPSEPLADLASLLARGYLRLLERSRQSAVSCAAAEQNQLEVPRPESPDDRVVPDVRRAG